MKRAIALGTFDGLHKGHRAVLALPDNMKKTAVIFPLPPKALLSGEPNALMTEKDKCAALKKIGIDEIYTLDFNEVRDMPPEEFLLFLIYSLSIKKFFRLFRVAEYVLGQRLNTVEFHFGSEEFIKLHSRLTTVQVS